MSALWRAGCGTEHNNLRKVLAVRLLLTVTLPAMRSAGKRGAKQQKLRSAAGKLGQSESPLTTSATKRRRGSKPQAEPEVSARAPVSQVFLGLPSVFAEGSPR